MAVEGYSFNRAAQAVGVSSNSLRRWYEKYVPEPERREQFLAGVTDMASPTTPLRTVLVRLVPAITLGFCCYHANRLPAATFETRTQSKSDSSSLVAVVRADWKRRQDRIASFTCQWTAKCVLYAHTELFYVGPDRHSIFLPEKDETITRSYSMQMDGNEKSRIDYTGPQLIEQLRGLAPRVFLAVTDGMHARGFFGKDESLALRFPPLGFIRKDPALPDLDAPDVRPLLMFCRPDIPAMQLFCNLSQYRFQSRSQLRGHDCVVLSRRDSGYRTLLYLDTKRRHVPLRIVRRFDDPVGREATSFVSYQGDFMYGTAADASVVLSGWEQLTRGAKDRPVYKETVTVKTFTANPQIPAATFQFVFPPNTIVFNEGTGEYYLKRPNGVKRHITVAEADARVPYRVLMETESGQGVKKLPEESRGVRYLLVAINLAALFVGCFAWWLIVRMRRHRRK